MVVLTDGRLMISVLLRLPVTGWRINVPAPERVSVVADVVVAMVAALTASVPPVKARFGMVVLVATVPWLICRVPALRATLPPPRASPEARPVTCKVPPLTTVEP